MYLMMNVVLEPLGWVLDLCLPDGVSVKGEPCPGCRGGGQGLITTAVGAICAPGRPNPVVQVETEAAELHVSASSNQ